MSFSCLYPEGFFWLELAQGLSMLFRCCEFNVQLPCCVQNPLFPIPSDPSFLLSLPQISLSLVGRAVRCMTLLRVEYSKASHSLCDDHLKVSVLIAFMDLFLTVLFSHRFNLHEGQTFNQLLPDTKIHEEVLGAISTSPVLSLVSTGTEHPHPEAKKTADAPKSWHALGSERSHHHGPPHPDTQEHGPEGHFTNISLCTF